MGSASDECTKENLREWFKVQRLGFVLCGRQAARVRQYFTAFTPGSVPPACADKLFFFAGKKGDRKSRD